MLEPRLAAALLTRAIRFPNCARFKGKAAKMKQSHDSTSCPRISRGVRFAHRASIAMPCWGSMGAS